MSHIGHFMRHDQVVLDVNGGLHIVADDAGAFAAGRHCASVWIGQRDLPIWRGLNGDLHLSQVLHLSLYICLSIAAGVYSLSRGFTALNRLPSIAITVSENKSSRRQSITNWRQVALIAGPLSLRKSAMVLRRPVS